MTALCQSSCRGQGFTFVCSHISGFQEIFPSVVPWKLDRVQYLLPNTVRSRSQIVQILGIIMSIRFSKSHGLIHNPSVELGWCTGVYGEHSAPYSVRISGKSPKFAIHAVRIQDDPSYASGICHVLCLPVSLLSPLPLPGCWVLSTPPFTNDSSPYKILLSSLSKKDKE